MKKTVLFGGALFAAVALVSAQDGIMKQWPLTLGPGPPVYFDAPEFDPLVRKFVLPNPFNAQGFKGPRVVLPRMLNAQVRINGRELIIPPGRNRIVGQLVDGQVFIELEGGEAIALDELEEGGTRVKSQPDPAGGQVLDFADGNRLHGTLEAFDSARQEIVWRRSDVSAPFTFPMAQIRHVTFNDGPQQEVKVHATVKCTGGDWLSADVLGMQGQKVQLKLGDGSLFAIDRAQIEWIYFSKNSAPECYDGPRGLAGWISGGGWSYREGALRASAQSAIARHFEVLPDQVEYLFEVDQGGDFLAFTIMLHGNNLPRRSVGPGNIQLMFRGNLLQVWAQMGGRMKAEQVDLGKVLRAPGELGASFKPDRKKPVQYRILEDHPGGRLIVFVDGRKAAEWEIGKGKPGENRGGFSFQPMTWSANAEQSLSKIRIIPWDGRLPKADSAATNGEKTDRVALAGGEVKEGKLESLTGDRIKLRTSGGTIELPREKVSLLTFGRTETPEDEEPPVARLSLVQRGEFDATGISYRKGKFFVRTSFCSELALPRSAVREIEYLRAAWSAPKQSDVLVFKNGDQLRGLLDTAAQGQKLQWRLARADAPLEIETARVGGVLFAPRPENPEARNGVLARFRNGDVLAGDFVTLDKEHVVLETAHAGQLSVKRDLVQTLYFSSDGALPVLDGATGRELWEEGVSFEQTGAAKRKKKTEGGAANKGQRSPWLYLDGSFSLVQLAGSQAGMPGTNNPHIGRIFESMPQRVECSFDVSSSNTPVFFSAQLFSEADNPGYMLQLHAQGVNLYDMAPRAPVRGLAQQQQQMPFGDKVKESAKKRRVRLLADRPSGKVTVIVDDAVVGHFGQRSIEGGRNLGRGFILTPQINVGCTFSNIWIGPWNGQVPGKAPALKSASLDTVLLANGDEAQGAIEVATPGVLKLDSDVGSLELPVPRLAMIDFGARPVERRTGIRLRFIDRGALTLKSYRIENDQVICESDVAGKLTLPLAVVQEVVFAGPGGTKTSEKP